MTWPPKDWFEGLDYYDVPTLLDLIRQEIQRYRRLNANAPPINEEAVQKVVRSVFNQLFQAQFATAIMPVLANYTPTERIFEIVRPPLVEYLDRMRDRGEINLDDFQTADQEAMIINGTLAVYRQRILDSHLDGAGRNYALLQLDNLERIHRFFRMMNGTAPHQRSKRAIKVPELATYHDSHLRQLLVQRLLDRDLEVNKRLGIIQMALPPSFSHLLTNERLFTNKKGAVVISLLPTPFNTDTTYIIRDAVLVESTPATEASNKRDKLEQYGDIVVKNSDVIITRYNNSANPKSESRYTMKPGERLIAVIILQTSMYQFEMYTLCYDFLSIDGDEPTYSLRLSDLVFSSNSHYPSVCAGVLDTLDYPLYLSRSMSFSKCSTLISLQIICLFLQVMSFEINEALPIVNPAYDLYMKRSLAAIDVNSHAMERMQTHLVRLSSDIQRLDDQSLKKRTVECPNVVDYVYSSSTPISQMHTLTESVQKSSNIKNINQSPEKSRVQVSIGPKSVDMDYDTVFLIDRFNDEWYVFAKIECDHFEVSGGLKSVSTDVAFHNTSKVNGYFTNEYTHVKGEIQAILNPTISADNIAITVYITQFWHYPPVVKSKGGAISVGLKPSRTTRKTEHPETHAKMVFRPTEITTLQYGRFYAIECGTLTLKSQSWATGEIPIVLHCTGEALDSVTVSTAELSPSLSSHSPFNNKNVLVSDDSPFFHDFAVVYHSPSKYDLDIDIKIIPYLFKVCQWVVDVKMSAGFKLELETVDEGLTIPIYGAVASSILDTTMYKLSMNHRMAKADAVLESLRSELKSMHELLNSIVEKPNAAQRISSYMSNIGMIVSFIQPEIGMIMFGVSSILNLTNADSPMEVIADVTQIAMAFHAVAMNPNMAARLPKLRDKIRATIDADAFATIRNLSEYHPFGKWSNIKDKLDTFKTSYLKLKQRPTTDAYEMDTLLHYQPQGHVHLITHDFTPTMQDSSQRIASDLSTRMPTVVKALRKMNLSPEHAKVKVIVHEVDPVSEAVNAHHYLFGVADYVMVSRDDLTQANMTICGIPTSKKSFNIGGVHVVEELAEDGSTRMKSFAECGYTETQARNIISSVYDQATINTVSIADLWLDLSKIIRSEEYQDGERVISTTAIPYPSMELCQGLIDLINTDADTFHYDLITNNCQRVSRDIISYLTGLKRPSWFPHDHFEAVIGRVSDDMVTHT